MSFQSTIPLLPWLTTRWTQYPASMGWEKICNADKYRVTLSVFNESGMWYIDPQTSGYQQGIPLLADGDHIKLEFKHYGPLMQQEVYAMDATFSGSISVFELIWKPLIQRGS